MDMKLKLFLPLVALAILTAGCNKPAGELVGVSNASRFKEANPYGMLFIKKGSFMMGANTQSNVFEQPDNVMMATVESFWMDETEITNNEYRQFVNWVRDSIARYTLAANEVDGFNLSEDETVIRLNWRTKIKWQELDKPVDEIEEDGYVRLKELLRYSKDNSLNTNRLHYVYEWKRYDMAVLARNKFDVATSTYPKGATVAVDSSWVNENYEICDSTIIRKLTEPADLISKKIICVYPDTLVWKRDYELSYNDPKLHQYFTHEGYLEYPVVGVTWEQARAFCNWRTKFFLSSNSDRINEFRLPNESEWEYAARGGRKMAVYPWGGDYARDAKGCFFANFKPYRGSLGDDTGVTPMKVGQFRPNDFGLFDMAGNVAEWTNSSFQNITNTTVHDLNPDFSYNALKTDPDIMKRKVVRGGSWKDISYFLQCGVRTYEYQFESRPYIGFRCVRSYIGD